MELADRPIGSTSSAAAALYVVRLRAASLRTQDYPRAVVANLATYLLTRCTSPVFSAPDLAEVKGYQSLAQQQSV